MLSRNFQTLLNRRGRTVTLSKPAYGTYNPATSTHSSNPTPTTYTVKAYLADYKLSEIDNESVVYGDRMAIIGTVDTSGATIPEPNQEDFITGAEGKVTIKAVQKIYNADTLVVYICQVRE